MRDLLLVPTLRVLWVCLPRGKAGCSHLTSSSFPALKCLSCFLCLLKMTFMAPLLLQLSHKSSSKRQQTCVGEMGCALALRFSTFGAIEGIGFPPGGWKTSTSSFLRGEASELYPSPYSHVGKQLVLGWATMVASALVRQEPAPSCLHPESF